jgi:phage I-like protein
MYHDEGREILGLSSVALVNKPALRLKALSSYDDNTQQESEKMTKELLDALGLKEDASDDDAIRRAKALAALESVDHTPPIDKWVPRSDYTDTLTRAEKAEAELATKTKEEREASFAAAVDAAVKAGKVSPAQRDQALALCRSSGLEMFAAFVDKAAVIGDDTDLDSRKPDDKPAGPHGLQPHELAVCKALGQNPKEFAEFKAAEAERNGA